MCFLTRFFFKNIFVLNFRETLLKCLVKSNFNSKAFGQQLVFVFNSIPFPLLDENGLNVMKTASFFFISSSKWINSYYVTTRILFMIIDFILNRIVIFFSMHFFTFLWIFLCFCKFLHFLKTCKCMLPLPESSFSCGRFMGKQVDWSKILYSITSKIWVLNETASSCTKLKQEKKNTTFI